MAIFKIVITVNTDWSETKIVSAASWTVPPDGKFFIAVGQAPLGAFQMTSKLIGLGKNKPWDKTPITVTAYIDTNDPNAGSVGLLSRKGAAGPVSYQSFIVNPSSQDVPVDYAVNDTNQDPLRIDLALRISTKMKRDAEADKLIKGADPRATPASVRTILPSDEPPVEGLPEPPAGSATARGRKR